MILGALGGPNTLAGGAAGRMRALYPEFTGTAYFATSEEGLAFAHGRADAMCVPMQAERTGFNPFISGKVADPASRLFVLAECEFQIRLSLLVKPGTGLSSLRRILGNAGGLRQCEAWLSANMPGVEIAILQSSLAAAQEIAAGNGDQAAIGTPGMAVENGLEEAVSGINESGLASYWALGPRPHFAGMPTRLVVTLRDGGDGYLGKLIADLPGFALQSVYSQSAATRLGEYDYVLRFAGEGSLGEVRRVLEAFPAARLAGAFEARE